jgi:hypothetical protein
MCIVLSPDADWNDALDPYAPPSARDRHALDAERDQAAQDASEDAQARDWHAALSAPDAPTVLFTPLRLRVLTAWLQQALAVAAGDACGIGRLGMGTRR